jgi:GT2 family glycosyltransferase
MKKTDKIAIGMINDGKINSQLVIDLLHIAKLRPQFDSFIQVANIGLITRSRNVLIKNFLEQSDAQWLLMMDADERMDLQSFDALVNTANGERKVVSALVFAAFFEDNDQLRPVPTIYRDVENYGLQPIEDYPLNEIIQVDATGTGCLLIHRSVILELQEKATEHQGKDWAWFVDGPINGTWFGEDLLFSKRLKSLGIPIYCNTSAILAHRKEFWLDNRHHTPFREYAIKNKAAE